MQQDRKCNNPQCVPAPTRLGSHKAIEISLVTISVPLVGTVTSLQSISSILSLSVQLVMRFYKWAGLFQSKTELEAVQMASVESR